MRRTKSEIISTDEAAREIFRVFIRRESTTRSLPKDYLLGRLKEPDVYSDFLKLCAENDKSDDLALFRRGLKFLVKCLGPSEVARKSKINRITLYRMLGKGGNPSVKTLVALLKAVGMNFWVVESSFLEKREEIASVRLVSDWMPKDLLSKANKLKRKHRLT
jgi:DNA-binding phage protein